MSAHEFQPFTDGDRISHACRVCAANYHCPRCNDGCSMMGHFTRDADGDFFWCEDPERWQRKLARERGGAS